MKHSIHSAPFLSLLLAVFLLSACTRETPPVLPGTPSADGASALEVEQSDSAQTSPQLTSQTPSATSSDSEASTDCRVGQVVSPGDSCTYPATTEEFRVDESGTASFLFLNATTVLEAQNASINDQAYNFAARKQDDGSWLVEVVGAPSESLRVADLIATAQPTATPLPTTAPVQPLTGGLPTPPALPTRTAQTPVSSPTPTVSLTVVATPAASVIVGNTPTPMPTTPVLLAPTPTPTSTVQPTVVVQQSTPTAVAVTAIPTATQVSTPAPAPIPTSEPEIPAAIGGHTVLVGESLVLDASKTFADTQRDGALRYRAIVSDTSVVQGDIDTYTGLLTVTGISEGESWIALNLCVGGECSETDNVAVLVNVVYRNRPPQAVSGIGDQQVRVGETIAAPLARAFWDFEADKIVGYQLYIDDGEFATGSVDRFRRIVELVGVREGDTAVSVSACDSHGCGGIADALRFTLTILPPPNNPPVAAGIIDDHTTRVGETISIDVSTLFDDPDGDAIAEYPVWHSDGKVAALRTDAATGILYATGLSMGFTLVSLSASDGKSTAVSEKLLFRLDVTEPPRMPPTVVGKVPDRTVKLGRSIDVSVSDSFQAPERYRVTRYDYILQKPEVAEESDISRAGILTLEGTEKGRSVVSVRACSYAGCSDFSDLTFVLFVTDPDEELNKGPEVVGALRDRTLAVGELEVLDVSLVFDDPDDDLIVDYFFEVDKPYLAIGSSITNTGVLRLKASNMGTTTVYLSACDDEDNCSNEDDSFFTLTVVAP
ncbi:MAG: hypothetical protein OXI16_03425 [Chloroflexota bacterium]|nr:hypothetical protein [Chloroflexota bacterium]